MNKLLQPCCPATIATPENLQQVNNENVKTADIDEISSQDQVNSFNNSYKFTKELTKACGATSTLVCLNDEP